MASKEELRAEEKKLKEKIASLPEKYQGTWKRELKRIRKLLYGHA
jgi:hypothetical protein